MGSLKEPLPHKHNVATSNTPNGTGITGHTKNQTVASATRTPSKKSVTTPVVQEKIKEAKAIPPARVKQVQPPYVQKDITVVGVTSVAYPVDTAKDLAQLKVLNHRDTACGTLNKSTVSWSAPICMKAKGSDTQFYCKQNATISCWSDYCSKVTDLCAEGSRKTIKRTHVEFKNPKGFAIISAPSLTILK